jgi:hypothetical protein
VDDELEGIWKEIDVTYFKVLLGNSPGVTEGKQKNIAGIVILWEEM